MSDKPVRIDVCDTWNALRAAGFVGSSYSQTQNNKAFESAQKLTEWINQKLAEAQR